MTTYSFLNIKGAVAVTKDGVFKACFTNVDDAFAYLLKVQGQSVAYALQFGGWVIVPHNPELYRMLYTFGAHVALLAEAKPGAKVGLSFWPDVVVDVAVDDQGLFVFTPKGGSPKHVGNVYGAIEFYAGLCAPAFAGGDEHETSE